jgi:hypothetical protein
VSVGKASSAVAPRDWLPGGPVSQGDLTVIDVPPVPTTKKRCRTGAGGPSASQEPGRLRRPRRNRGGKNPPAGSRKKNTKEEPLSAGHDAGYWAGESQENVEMLHRVRPAPHDRTPSSKASMTRCNGRWGPSRSPIQKLRTGVDRRVLESSAGAGSTRSRIGASSSTRRPT